MSSTEKRFDESVANPYSGRPHSLAEYTRRLNVWLARVTPGVALTESEAQKYHNGNCHTAAAATQELRLRGFHWHQPGSTMNDALFFDGDGDPYGTEPPPDWPQPDTYYAVFAEGDTPEIKAEKTLEAIRLRYCGRVAKPSGALWIVSSEKAGRVIEGFGETELEATDAYRVAVCHNIRQYAGRIGPGYYEHMMSGISARKVVIGTGYFDAEPTGDITDERAA